MLHTITLLTPKRALPKDGFLKFITQLIDDKIVEIDYFGIEPDNQADFIDADMQSKIDNNTFINIYFQGDDIDYNSFSADEILNLAINVLNEPKRTSDIKTDENEINIYLYTPWSVAQPFSKNPAEILISFDSIDNPDGKMHTYILMRYFDQSRIDKIIDLNIFFKEYYTAHEVYDNQYRAVSFSKNKEDETLLFEKILTILDIEVNPIINFIAICFLEETFKDEDILGRLFYEDDEE